jgi:hypothetical protein
MAQGCVGRPPALQTIRPVPFTRAVVLRQEEVVMVRASQPKSLQLDLAERPQPVHQARTSFVWSHAKIRIASLVLAAVATPAAAAFAAPAPFVKWLCLVWLCGIAVLMQGLSRRVNDGAVVLSVDRRGILDHRLISRHIAWQEIKTIWPVNADRNHTIDIELRWPKTTLRDTRWSVRVGAYCQMGYGVPAVTISMLLLDGSVSDLLNAIALYRPDLLDYSNLRASPKVY